MLRILNEARDIALIVFGKVTHVQIYSGDLYDQYLDDLKARIDSFEDKFIGENRIKANSYDSSLFSKLSSPIMSKLNQRFYKKENTQDLLDDINAMVEDYSQKAMGIEKTKILCEKMKLFMPSVIQAFCQNVSEFY